MKLNLLKLLKDNVKLVIIAVVLVVVAVLVYMNKDMVIGYVQNLTQATGKLVNKEEKKDSE